MAEQAAWRCSRGASLTAVSRGLQRACALQGVWVLATIRGSIAARAGIHQGDQVLAVNGASVAGQSAYRVASMIQTQSTPPREVEGAQPQSTTMTLQARLRGGCTRLLLPCPAPRCSGRWPHSLPVRREARSLSGCLVPALHPWQLQARLASTVQPMLHLSITLMVTLAADRGHTYSQSTQSVCGPSQRPASP